MFLDAVSWWHCHRWFFSEIHGSQKKRFPQNIFVSYSMQFHSNYNLDNVNTQLANLFRIKRKIQNTLEFATYHKKSYHSYSIRLTVILYLICLLYFLCSQRVQKRVHKQLCIFHGKHPSDHRLNVEVNIWNHHHRHHHHRKERCHVRMNLKWKKTTNKQTKEVLVIRTYLLIGSFTRT